MDIDANAHRSSALPSGTSTASSRRSYLPQAIARDGKPSPIAARRRRGLVWILVGFGTGAALFAALIGLVKLGIWQPNVVEHVTNGLTIREERYSAIWALPVVIPVFTTMLGAVELITGGSLRDFAKTYESMPGWRRFLVSILVVGLALVVIGTVVSVAIFLML